MNPPRFTAFAKAQAFGLALGFALALWATDKMGFGLSLFLIATAGAWLAWEFALGPRAPSHRGDVNALRYGLLTGFAFPWIGFALAALAAWMAP